MQEAFAVSTFMAVTGADSVCGVFLPRLHLTHAVKTGQSGIETSIDSRASHCDRELCCAAVRSSAFQKIRHVRTTHKHALILMPGIPKCILNQIKDVMKVSS